MKTIEQLRQELAQAVADCERYRIAPGQVRNCPSDLQNLDDAWRRRKALEAQLGARAWPFPIVGGTS